LRVLATYSRLSSSWNRPDRGISFKICACGKTLGFSGQLPRTRPFYLRPWEPCLISLSSRLQEKFPQMASHFDEVGTKIAFGIIMWTPLLPSTSSVMLRSAETLDNM
jgi:hypothetical protein